MTIFWDFECCARGGTVLYSRVLFTWSGPLLEGAVHRATVKNSFYKDIMGVGETLEQGLGTYNKFPLIFSISLFPPCLY